MIITMQVWQWISIGLGVTSFTAAVCLVVILCKLAALQRRAGQNTEEVIRHIAVALMDLRGAVKETNERIDLLEPGNR